MVSEVINKVNILLCCKLVYLVYTIMDDKLIKQVLQMTILFKVTLAERPKSEQPIIIHCVPNYYATRFSLHISVK